MQSEGVKWNRPGEMSWIGTARDTRLDTDEGDSNTISSCLICSYVADPATFLASNGGPYFHLRTACLFSYTV